MPAAALPLPAESATGLPAQFPAYAELHCLSNFSFQRGASHPEELVVRAAELGYAALAITDECSLAGVVRAWRAHCELPESTRPQLIIGSELQIHDGPAIVLLAMNRGGYAQLSRLISAARRAAGKGEYHLPRQALDAAASRLDGCLALLLPPAGFPVTSAPGMQDDASTALCADARWLGEHFPGRAWMAVETRMDGRDRSRITRLRRIAREAGIGAVAATGALMHDAARQPLADVLCALRLHCSVAEAGFALAANAERRLHERATLARRLPPALLAETLQVAARCSFRLDELRYEYPQELVPADESPASWLRRLVEGGLQWRYRACTDATPVAQPAAHAAPPPAGQDPAPPAVRTQIEHELALIVELGYEAYFLTVHDIVRFAREARILCQGRGSAANSAVCWALGITEVDPGLGILLFERFISRERREPPDIDVDFEHERREEVIQYLYRKYGRERAALAATVITYRTRSAVRDVGRALGLDASLVERISREHQWFDGRGIDAERLRDAGLDPSSPALRQLLTLVGTLVGFPRHLSQHVGGFVIARGRLDELVPVENAAMPERTVIQWDKDDLDALGLLKVDVLALGMLSALRRGLALVSAWRGQPVTLAGIERERPEVYAMLTRADAIGVFQVESRAQLSMLPRLRPQCFYDLVVEVAIVRPGPVQGGMVHPYLQARECRARGEDPLQALRAEIRPVLARTLGVPIFQEQVMRLAVVAAGFTPGEADQLRRAMGSWRRQGELARYREQLLQGMAANGYDPDFAERLCRQIEGFGDYGFPESHAASFALLVYASAWLKCFEPAAFLAAMLNSQPMGFYSASQLIQDARRHDIEVRPPDVTVSVWDCTLEARSAADAQADAQPAVRLGLRLVRGLRREAAQAILAAREAAAFASVAELAARAQLDAATLRVLASSGSLAALAGHRRQAVWQATGAVPLPGLLAATTTSEAALALPAPAEAEELLTDYARLGFTLGRHPLALLRPQLTQLRFLDASAISAASDRMLARAAGLVTCRQRPATAKGTLFITLEDETGFTNVIVHPDVFERQRHILLGARLLGVYGQISRQASVVHLIAARVVDHSALLGELQVQSRDFH